MNVEVESPPVPRRAPLQDGRDGLAGVPVLARQRELEQA
jgi:hypothetical protein